MACAQKRCHDVYAGVLIGARGVAWRDSLNNFGLRAKLLSGHCPGSPVAKATWLRPASLTRTMRRHSPPGHNFVPKFVPGVRLALTTARSSGECSNYLSYPGNGRHYTI